MKLSRINFYEIEWYKYLSYLGLIISMVWVLFDTGMQRRLISSITQPAVIFMIIFNISFSYYVFSLTPANVFGGSDDVTTADNLTAIARLRLATQRALTAFIVAYLAYLDHYTAAFWVIWVFSYYLPV
jgi:hypothetical protein